MAQKIDADVNVRRLGFASGEGGPRLLFPHSTAHNVDGRSGSVAYGAKELVLDGLEGRLDRVQWQAEAASIGEVWLRDDSGRLELAMARAELPHGLALLRAERGVELAIPHASLLDVQFTFHIPAPSEPTPTPPPPTTSALRQERLRFLDGVSGKIHLTIKVKLDLPVLGARSLDQTLRVPIAEGGLDFRALDDSLNWLEGAFLDLGVDQDRLAVSFRVPIFGASRDIISWALDRDAGAMARFGRVPLRSLVDFRVGKGGTAEPKPGDKKKSILRALKLDGIEVALSMLAPRHLEVGGGTILFGGDDAPGIVDLQIAGAIDDRAHGSLRGTAGSVDTTIKDLHLGALSLSADRLSFDRIEDLHVVFEGFLPKALSFTVHRVIASNLRLTISG